MKSYNVRIIFTHGKIVKRSIKAITFNKAVEKTKARYKTWLRHGHDVQIFNPGENCNLPQSQYVGIH